MAEIMTSYIIEDILTYPSMLEKVIFNGITLVCNLGRLKDKESSSPLQNTSAVCSSLGGSGLADITMETANVS